MRINTHILSLMSQRTLLSTTKALARAMQRLASGQRINSARDDAAGMALGTGLESQRRGMLQAVRNMNDSRGFLSTAEGALSAQTELIQRMRELALQSANGTLSDTERGYLNTELQQLVSEFDRVAKQTEFNGVKLLDGSFATTSLQVGDQKGQLINFSLGSAIAEKAFENTTEVLTTTLAGTGTFTLAVTGAFADGVGMRGVGFSDFDGDGQTDVAYLGAGAANLIIYKLGGGGTSVTSIYSSHVGTNGYGLAVGDVNGDGKADAMVSYPTTVQIRLGNGNGTFQAGSAVSTGVSGFHLKLRDVNGDGNEDALWLDSGTDTLSICFGNGNGTFQARLTLDAAVGLPNGEVTENALDFGDINGDGKLDIVTGDAGDNTVSIYLSNGDGTFQSRFTRAVGYNCDNLTVNDVNDDGFADILIGNDNNFRLTILTGNGNGTFTQQSIWQGNYTGSVGVSDVNGDGVKEIIAAVYNSAYRIFSVDGSGTWSQTGTFGSGTGITPYGFRMFDANADGVLDLWADSNTGTTAGIFLADTHEISDSSELTGLESMFITTQAQAQNVLGILDSASEYINNLRSSVGAIQSRLDYAENNALNLIENISAARSQLMDADFAEETAEFTRLQILQQAGLAVMGQANLNLKLTLELLR